VARLSEAGNTIKAQRQQDKANSETNEQKELVKQLKAELKPLRAQLKEASQALKKDVVAQAKFAAAEALCKQQRKLARDSCGVFWGSSAIKVAAVDAARDATWLWRDGEPNDPHFKRWEGYGSVAVQLQHGLSVEDLLAGKDQRARLVTTEPPPVIVQDRPGRGPRPVLKDDSKRTKRRQRYTLWLRVSSEGRAPIWAKWHCLMHRSLPEGAEVTWAKVIKERLAGKDRWSLHLTLRIPDSETVQGHPFWDDVESVSKKQKPTGVVALDLGWRRVDAGLRAAYAIGDDGTHYELILGPEIEKRLDRIDGKDGLESIRKKNFNAMQEWLVAWMAGNPVPDSIKERAKTLAKWESQARLAALTLLWRDNRFDGDDEVFTRLEEWRKQDKHLWSWETHLRDKVLRRRKHQYREFAAKLAKIYGTLILENLDLRDFQKREKTKDGKKTAKPPRTQQKTVSPSELRLCLLNAFSSNCGLAAWVEPANTTLTCHACGLVEKWDTAKELIHTCSGCKTLWDQDANACQNFLHMFCKWCDGSLTVELIRVEDFRVKELQESKWAKLNRNRSKDDG
jgi:hypothetical protein